MENNYGSYKTNNKKDKEVKKIKNKELPYLWKIHEEIGVLWKE